LLFQRPSWKIEKKQKNQKYVCDSEYGKGNADKYHAIKKTKSRAKQAKSENCQSFYNLAFNQPGPYCA